MKAVYDREADALYLRLSKAPIMDSEEIRPGVIFDFDPEGRIVAIEFLGASKQLPADALRSQPIE